MQFFESVATLSYGKLQSALFLWSIEVGSSAFVLSSQGYYVVSYEAGSLIFFLDILIPFSI